MSLKHSFAKITSYEAPHYAVFSNLLSFPTARPGPTINTCTIFAVKYLECLMLKIDFKGMGCSGIDLIHLDQDMDQWRAFVNAVMNFRLHKILGIG
jgi:hypothetical protein